MLGAEAENLDEWDAEAPSDDSLVGYGQPPVLPVEEEAKEHH